KEKLKYRESKKLSKKHIFLRVFSKITISVCVFCAFFISPVFAILPAGFTELEYIESTGTQYIDTGYIWTTDNAIVETEVYRTEDVTSGHGIYGNQKGTQHGLTLYKFGSSGTSTYGAQFGENGTTISTNLSLQTWYTLAQITDGNTIRFSVNQVEQSQSIKKTLDKTNSVYLFTSHYNTGTDGYAKIRCKYFKLIDDGTLVRNLVPAKRNSDGEIGMYDTVSGTFFTNQGTGEFIAGPVVEIKIATTKMVDEEFAAAEAKLATTVQTIESVVSRTITQTGQIQVLQDTKQTRPDESCPANMKCLLVQDENGTPHWYPIIEP
ncbi:MAG: hypothetical protein KBT14_00590, partial [Proteobacteria bacterium]|nr:hypothetical protein [Candidatus Enterousia onthequi]